VPQSYLIVYCQYARGPALTGDHKKTKKKTKQLKNLPEPIAPMVEVPKFELPNPEFLGQFLLNTKIEVPNFDYLKFCTLPIEVPKLLMPNPEFLGQFLLNTKIEVPNFDYLKFCTLPIEVPKLLMPNPEFLGQFLLNTKIEVPNLLVPSLAINEKSLPLNTPISTISTYNNFSEAIKKLKNATCLLEEVTVDVNNKDSFNSTIYSLQKNKNDIEIDQLKLLKANPTDLEYYEKAVKDYGELINKPNVEELELQSYFELNPILLDRGLKQVFAKKSFGGEAFPDFIAILQNDTHILIEIEKPSKKLYTKKGYPTTALSEAEQQVRDYIQWVTGEKEFLRRRGLPNIGVENTKGLLVIGMRKDLTNREKEKLLQQNFSVRSTHEIKTFDDILEENLQVIKSIQEIRKKI
jgi:hypothetical protein